jgi:hypothetical protein
MNSYELSRVIFDYSFENPTVLKPNHFAVYFFAVEQCNRLGWKKQFGFPSSFAMEATGIKSYNTYTKALNELVDLGFIEMVERSRNQYQSCIIALSKFDKALDKALDKANVKHLTKQRESTVQSADSIDKQLNKETIKPINNEPSVPTKVEKIVFSEDVNFVYDSVLPMFPDTHKPKNEKQVDKWKDTIDKLMRIDKVDAQSIIHVTEKVRSDEFWKKNFLTINKLREKKDGVARVFDFIERFKKPIRPANFGTAESFKLPSPFEPLKFDHE